MSGSPGFLRTFTSPVLSSEVGDVLFQTDREFARIYVMSAYSPDPVYSATLYPSADGVCTAFQLGDVITQWMRDNAFSFHSFIMGDSVSGVSMSLQVLRSSFVSVGLIDGFNEVLRKPLLSSTVDVLSRYARSFFHYLRPSPPHADDLKVSALVSGRLFDGSVQQVAWTLDASLVDDRICSVAVRPDVLRDDINDGLDDDSEFAEISAVVLNPKSMPSVSASVFVSDDPDLMGFSFINSFGLLESLFLHGEAVPELTVDAESAVIGHRTVMYDVEQSQSFKVEARNIAQSDWRKVVQFLASPEVYDAESGRRIFISDISQEPPKAYGSLGSVKFNYSYEDSRLVF